VRAPPAAQLPSSIDRGLVSQLHQGLVSQQHRHTFCWRVNGVRDHPAAPSRRHSLSLSHTHTHTRQLLAVVFIFCPAEQELSVHRDVEQQVLVAILWSHLCVRERERGKGGEERERQREMMCSDRQHYIRMCVFKCVCVRRERARERGEQASERERESETDSKEIGVCMCARAYILVHVYIYTHDILGISHHRHFVKGRISKSTL
jgi:hypothetical protein